MLSTLLSRIPLPVKDWTYTLLIGALVVTYWRGSWVLLDHWTCDQHHTASLADGDSFCYLVPAMEDAPNGYYTELRKSSAGLTYGIGQGLLFTGLAMLWSGAWVPKLTVLKDGSTVSQGEVTLPLAVVRFVINYILGASAVCIWRGIWYWADAWILPSNPLASYWTCSLVGSSVAFLCGAGASLLAPPAIFLLDGPGRNPPPIGVTVLSSHYSLTLPCDERPPKLPLHVRVLDVLGSFVFLPFMIVWYWRGTWMLLDYYFWGFTIEDMHIHYSKLWGSIFAVLCIAIASEPLFARITSKVKNRHILGLLGRLRTYILAWGTVSFWRVIWYVWDQFAGTSSVSAWTSHVVGLVGLLAMGCVTSINAPASTLGVDTIPDANCADEPLFAMVPVPYDLIHLFGIGRQEPAEKKAKVVRLSIVETEMRKTKMTEAEKSKRRFAGAGKVRPTDDLFGDSAKPLHELAIEKIDEEEDIEAGGMEAEHPSGEKELDNELVDSAVQSFTQSFGSGQDGGRRVSLFNRQDGSDGKRISYYELQRPQLGCRRHTEIAQRPYVTNHRRRSTLYRTR